MNNLDKTENASMQEEAEAYQLLNDTKNLRHAKSSLYVSKKNQYEDAGSTAIVFCIFGLIGILCDVLCMLHIISLPIMLTTYSQITMLLFFIIFSLIGLFSWKKAKSLKGSISSEEDLNHSIREWLQSHITAQQLHHMEDDNAVAEVNYLNHLSYIQEEISNVFPDVPEDQVSFLADEFLSALFESDEC